LDEELGDFVGTAEDDCVLDAVVVEGGRGEGSGGTDEEGSEIPAVTGANRSFLQRTQKRKMNERCT
jgi:hypothetical protein